MHYFVAAILALTLMAPDQALAGDKTCGKYKYEVIGSEEKLKGAKGIEIREFFNYSCGHCYQVLTAVETLHKKYKDKLLHKKYPIYWGEQTPYPSRAYYITDELGLEKDFTRQLFDTNFKLNINIFQPKVIRFLAMDLGIEKEMQKGMESKAIQAKVENSLLLAKKYGANETPTVIVNDVLRFKPSLFDGSVEKMTECLDLTFDNILSYNK